VAEHEAKSHQKTASEAIHGQKHSSCSLPPLKPRLSRDSLAKSFNQSAKRLLNSWGKGDRNRGEDLALAKLLGLKVFPSFWKGRKSWFLPQLTQAKPQG